MTAAAILYVELERNYVKSFIASLKITTEEQYHKNRGVHYRVSFKDEVFMKKQAAARKIWFWGLHRWGKAFSAEEYRIRELEDRKWRGK